MDEGTDLLYNFHLVNLKLDLNITRNIFKKDIRLRFICEICFSVAVCYTCKLVKCPSFFPPLFSSPEPLLRLKVSYCDNRMYVVRQSVVPQCVVLQSVVGGRAGFNNFFYIASPPKPLRENSPNFTGMILGLSSSKFFKDFHSMQKSGCHGNQKEKLKKIFLSKTAGQI